MEAYATDFTVTIKDDGSPLTEADIAAHHTIVAGLAALTPDLPVLSEEQEIIPNFTERASWGRYWLVDPLDGTREFVKRNGEFTVNIALIEGHRPVLGVVSVPVSGDCYFACNGGGAYKQILHGAPHLIHVRTCKGDRCIVAGSRSHRTGRLEEFLANIGNYEVLSIGSSIKSCLVAEGRADIYPRLGPTSEWDTAAAQCVIEEAGGRMTDTSMRPLRYNTKDSLLNPHFLAFGDTQQDWSWYVPKP